MSEPYYASIVWADESTVDAVRDTRAEAEAWLRETLATADSDPMTTVVIPERHRQENRQLGHEQRSEHGQSAAVAASAHEADNQAFIDGLSAELDGNGYYEHGKEGP